ncbi:hypothetical protein ACHAXA_009136 [Cyclostephanos tholiformis]|uniref:Uncharacterized protein n=1 Tax=Cyclostephanos tholiformis TaxID=382380 RepID=A0ABD3RWY1_9STRA
MMIRRRRIIIVARRWAFVMMLLVSIHGRFLLLLSSTSSSSSSSYMASAFSPSHVVVRSRRRRDSSSKSNRRRLPVVSSEVMKMTTMGVSDDDDHPPAMMTTTTTTTTTTVAQPPQPIIIIPAAIPAPAAPGEEHRVVDGRRSSPYLADNDNETSRKFRRTVYDHADWSEHRTSYLFDDIHMLFDGVIMNQIKGEVALTVLIAFSVCSWNALVGGYQDVCGNMHYPVIPHSLPVDDGGWRWLWWWPHARKVGIPMEAFALVSPSLGLLLVFRTSASYKRWNEARKVWSITINHMRDVTRMASAWYGIGVDEDVIDDDDGDDDVGESGTTTTTFAAAAAAATVVDDDDDDRDRDAMTRRRRQRRRRRRYLLGQVRQMTWAFVRSMKRHLSPEWEDEDDFRVEVRSRLDPEVAESLISASHRPYRARFNLCLAIESLPIHFSRKDAINKTIFNIEDSLGGSSRILEAPIPLLYTRHTARFLAAWLLALPLGLYGQFGGSWNHVMMIPASAFVSICLFGIEELATQMEEPFTILPMQAYCDTIWRDCDEIVSWAINDDDDDDNDGDDYDGRGEMGLDARGGNDLIHVGSGEMTWSVSDEIATSI